MYFRSYDGQTKWIYLLTDDDDLWEKYDTSWDKASIDIEKEFDSELVYNKKPLKIKIKSYGDKATYRHDKESSRVGSNHTCLEVINLDSALKNMKIIILKCF